MPSSVGFSRLAKKSSTASWRSTREAIGKLRAAVASRSRGCPAKWRARRFRVADRPLTIRNICPITSPPLLLGPALDTPGPRWRLHRSHATDRTAAYSGPAAEPYARQGGRGARGGENLEVARK